VSLRKLIFLRQNLLRPLAALSAILLAAGPARGQDGALPRGDSGAAPAKPAPQAAPAPGQPTMPRPLNYTPPEYPPEAQKEGLEATVTLQLDISKEGKVIKAVVIEPAGHGFDESAVAAAQKLDFEPARRPDGTPFAARILYRYSFTLDEKKEALAQGQGQAPAAEKKRKTSFGGTILASGGDAQIAGASVTVTGAEGQNLSITTGTDGSFTFEDITPGSYKVIIEVPGFQPLSVEETVAEGESIEVKYRLVPQGGELEVTIRGARPPREVVKRTLEQREISRIPGTNGDALRSIQSLPGVARPPGLAGLLLVRGSGPQNTQTFVSGTPVPLIYHFGGLSSVIPTELLEKIDFYPGNFSSQYGRVTGGIVDAGIRSPKNDGKYHGLLQADLIDARFVLEGPIPLLKGWNFAAAARRSYIDAWLGPALTAAGAGVTQAPVYYDYQVLAETRPTSGSKLRLAFFGADDALELIVDRPTPGEPALTGNFGLHTGFKRIQALYSNDLENGDKINAVVALGQDNIDFGLGAFFFNLDVKTITGRFEYTSKLSKGVLLNTGLDMYWGHYDVALRAPAPPAPGAPPNQPFSTRAVQEVKSTGYAYQPAAYAELELAPTSRLRLVPGLRLDYFQTTKQFDFSPRFNGRYIVRDEFPRTTAKVGLGFYQQPPQFQESVPPLGNPNLKSNRAIHYALGVEQEVTRQVEASVEGFFKQLDNDVVSVPSPSGASLEYTNQGKGYVVGSEFLLKYKPDDRFFGWLAYTLSRSARTPGPGEEERLVSFDQTHILTVLGSYRLGGGWEFGARFRLISGNLVTPNVCNPSLADCNPNRTNALFHAPSGVYTAIPFGAARSERLPMFHQLDVRVDKKWQFKTWQLSTYIDIQNVYNNANTEGIQYNFNFTARQYVSGLPILPSFGLRGEF